MLKSKGNTDTQGVPTISFLQIFSIILGVLCSSGVLSSLIIIIIIMYLVFPSMLISANAEVILKD